MARRRDVNGNELYAEGALCSTYDNVLLETAVNAIQLWPRLADIFMDSGAHGEMHLRLSFEGCGDAAPSSSQGCSTLKGCSILRASFGTSIKDAVFSCH